MRNIEQSSQNNNPPHLYQYLIEIVDPKVPFSVQFSLCRVDVAYDKLKYSVKQLILIALVFLKTQKIIKRYKIKFLYFNVSFHTAFCFKIPYTH